MKYHCSWKSDDCETPQSCNKPAPYQLTSEAGELGWYCPSHAEYLMTFGDKVIPWAGTFISRAEADRISKDGP